MVPIVSLPTDHSRLESDSSEIVGATTRKKELIKLLFNKGSMTSLNARSCDAPEIRAASSSEVST